MSTTENGSGAQLKISNFIADCQDKNAPKIDLSYNPSPHQYHKDLCRALNLEIPRDLIFMNGDLETECVLCHNAKAQSRCFGMCQKCHYDRFFGLIHEVRDNEVNIESDCRDQEDPNTMGDCGYIPEINTEENGSTNGKDDEFDPW